MFKSMGRRCWSWIGAAFHKSKRQKAIRKAPCLRSLLEELESRLAPAAGLGASNNAILQSYGQLPLRFEANAGQTAAQVQYLSHGSGYALFLTSTSSVLSLNPAGSSGAALALNLVGANSQATFKGQDLLPGTSNYFIGSDPSQWHANVANFGQVDYQDIYPGVNLVYYGNQQQLEYDFVVAPGSNPGSIRFDIQGASCIKLDDQGNLVLSTAVGDVVEKAPVIYQVIGGARQAVSGQFVLLSGNEVGFQVGAYDSSLPLTIDPVLKYSTYLGGTGSDASNGIAVDGSGNAYITGYTNSTDFPATTGAFQTGFLGANDVFVTKLNAGGTALVYSTYLGGNNTSVGAGIAVDSSGDAYVTGKTSSTSFPTTANAFQTSYGGGKYDAFVTKLNPAGTGLVYSTYLGGTGDDEGNGIAVNSAGNAFVTGQTQAGFDPIISSAVQSAFGGGNFDAFVVKLNPAGTDRSYATYLGGSSDDVGYGIVLDTGGNAYVTGQTLSANFPTTAGALQTAHANDGGLNDAFVAKLSPAGSAFGYSTYLGGSGDDAGFGIAVDASGNAYVTGQTQSANFPTTTGAAQVIHGNDGGTYDAFVAKLNANGTGIAYSTFLGGNGYDAGTGIALDVFGNAYISGYTNSTDYPVTANAAQTTYGGDLFDAFVAKLNSVGSAFTYSTYLGGNDSDYGYGIAVDGWGNAYTSGVTASQNFPTTANAIQANQASFATDDAFVAKVDFSRTDHFVITNVNPTSVQPGGLVSFTLTAKDNSGNTVTDYTGTVQLTSTDSQASFNGNVLPANYTFTVGDAGAHTFTVMMQTGGNQTITATDLITTSLTATTPTITVSFGSFSKFVVNVVGGSPVVAGDKFVFTVQATDANGNPVSNYNGPTSITATISPGDPQSNFPITGTLQVPSLGFGFFQGSLKTAGTYTLTVTAGSFSSAGVLITVVPAYADYFTVSAPASAITGRPINVTVTAYDHYNNIVTGYTGTVGLSSTDGAASFGSGYTFTTGGQGADNGMHTFSVTLLTAGTQTIRATETAVPSHNGVSGPIVTRGLTVASFTPTATGFTAAFSKPFLPADLTMTGLNQTVVQDVVLRGAKVGPIHGSLIIDPSNMSITFNATASYLKLLNSVAKPATASVVLPDDTYTATLVSGAGANGFQDILGTFLDGASNTGHANYVTTFATHFQANATPALGIPDFARGPDSNTPILVPNDSAHGIPITLYDAAGVTDVTFTLNYNPALLNITGTVSGAGSDATDPAAILSLVSNAGGVATFHYQDANPKTAGPKTPLRLGDIQAVVPNSAANNYKAKEFLQLGNIVINSGAITGTVPANSIHVNAYLGDVTGDGILDGLDTLTANQIAIGAARGFNAYQLLDPVVVGDAANDLSVDAGDVSVIDLYVAQLSPAQIPAPPGLAVTIPNAADPTLSLGGGVGRPAPSAEEPAASAGAPFDVTVNLDHPIPTGSTGLSEAILALTYDPAVLSVTSADISLGSIPKSGTGWHLTAVIDQTTGQIGIELYSLTPVTAAQAGSLVNIAFHVVGEPSGISRRVPPQTTVQLVDSVTPNGQRFGTLVADSQGAMILSPGLDRLVVPMSAPAALAEAQAALRDDTGVSELFGPGQRGVELGFGADALVVLSNGSVAGDSSIPADVLAAGALAFETKVVAAASLAPIGQVYQISAFVGQERNPDLRGDWDQLLLPAWLDEPIQDAGAAVDQIFADLGKKMGEV